MTEQLTMAPAYAPMARFEPDAILAHVEIEDRHASRPAVKQPGRHAAPDDDSEYSGAPAAAPAPIPVAPAPVAPVTPALPPAPPPSPATLPSGAAPVWTPSRASMYLTPSEAPKLSPYASVWQGPETTPATPSAARANASMTGWAPPGTDTTMGLDEPRRGLALRTSAILVLAVAIIGAGTFGAIKYLKQSGPAQGHTITVPSAAAGYQLRTDEQAEQLAQTAKQTMVKQANSPEVAELLTTAQVGAYTPPTSQPAGNVAVFVTLDLTKSQAALTEVKANGPSAEATAELNGAGVKATAPADAGPLGGSLQCGLSSAETPYPICVWVDGSTSGMLALAGTVALADAPAITLAFRAAAEH